MLADVIIIHYADSALIGEALWPSELGVTEAAIEDEQFAPLVQGGTRLDQRSRGFACFDDDGRGLDSALLRRTAVDRGMIAPEAAEQLTHRQAIKLIFKKGFTTMEEPTSEGGKGMGMALVRRYVADAGGRVALASDLGRYTRLRVALPPLEGEQEQDQSEVA